MASVLRYLWSTLPLRENYFKSPDQVGTPVDPSKPVSTQSKIREYDVVIIGGGTSALALANRLTEDPSTSVLVLEAGCSGMTVVESVTPAAFGGLFQGIHSWNYFTIPQVHMNGRRAIWPRAKLLGGCSSTNAMMFHHGAPEDFDEWAKIGGVGAEDWAYSKFQMYLQKFETHVPLNGAPLPENTERGTSGPIKTGYFNHVTPLGEDFLAACDAAGIPNVADLNTSKGSLGSSRVPTYIDSTKTRSSTESAYLTMDVLRRPNLTVATMAHVTRIVTQTAPDGSVRATGIEFKDPGKKITYTASARKEIVVSAGAIGTPHLLMLSGIGPAEHLHEHQIPVVKDIPGVGQSLYDHPQVLLRFKIKSDLSTQFMVNSGLLNTLKFIKAVAQYKLASLGPLSMTWNESYGFIRSSDPSLFPPSQYGSLEDTSSGPGAPDIELMFSPMTYGFNMIIPPGNFMTLTSILLRPSSVGTIKLKSNDPYDSPNIDANYLGTEHDMEVLLRGIKQIIRILKTEPLASIVEHGTWADDHLDIDNGIFSKTDDQIRDLIKERLVTIFHPTSTAKMGNLEDGGVVDAKLRVHGISGLRVVDASIMPKILSGHTAAASIAIGEKAADMMKEALVGKPQ